MSLAKKYGIPPEVVTKMVHDGVISCSWPMYEEIYAEYQKLIVTGRTKTDIYLTIAESKGVSERTVKAVVSRLGKI